MKTSFKTRAAAVFASFVVTWCVVGLIAGYALPEPAPVQVAAARTR